MPDRKTADELARELNDTIRDSVHPWMIRHQVGRPRAYCPFCQGQFVDWEGHVDVCDARLALVADVNDAIRDFEKATEAHLAAAMAVVEAARSVTEGTGTFVGLREAIATLKQQPKADDD